MALPAASTQPGSAYLLAPARMRRLAWALPILSVLLIAQHLWRVQAGHEELLAETRARETQHLAQLTDAKANQIEALLAGADLVVRDLRDHYASGRLDAAHASIRSAFAVFPKGAIVHFSVVDARGFVEFTTLPVIGPVNLSDREYFQALAARPEDRLYVGKPVRAKVGDAWLLPITRPIIKDGRFAGMAVLSLSPRFLSEALAKLLEGENDVISLFFDDGTYCARSRDLDKVLGTRLPANRPFLQPGSSQRGVFSVVAFADQRARLYGWQKLAAAPMVLNVGLDEAAMLAPVRAEIRLAWLRNAIAVPLILELVAVLSWLMFRSARHQSLHLTHAALLQATLDSTADGILVVGPEGQVLESNRRFRELWRIPVPLLAKGRDEALLQYVLDQLNDPEAFLGGVRATYQSAEKKQDLLSFKDGRIFERYTQPVIQDGERARLWSFRDVTEATRAENALRESEHRLRLAQEGAQIGIWEWDLASNQTYWSPECERMYGLAPGAPRDNHTWRKLVHPEDLPLIDAEWERRIAKHEPFEVEYRLCQPSGEIRWLSTKGRAHRDEAGQVVRLSGINLDITERKQTEDRLRQLSLAVEQSPEAIAITDLQARIEYVNEAFVRSAGYSREELIGRNPRVLQSGHTTPAQYAAMWVALTAGEIWKGEFTNRRKDGSEYIEAVVIAPIREPDGRVSHYLGLKADITEKTRLLEELQAHRHHLEELVAERTAQLGEARDRAEAANRAKSAFLANVSHEIRTPLNAITGMTYLMRQGGLPLAQACRLDKIETAGRHLVEIINAVLDLSKIEAGHFVLEEGHVDVHGMLGAVAAMLQERVQDKHLELVVSAPSALPPLLGDAVRLQQALLNYAGNAVKFTEQGTVTLRAAVLEQTADEVLLRFEVQDTGIGIEPQALPRLFTAFEQADNSTTRKYGGTGLGLSITKRLAELMGGQAGVDSTPGVGSSFWFSARLRVAATAAPLPAPLALESARDALRRECRGQRVLIAEDEIVNREVARSLLADVGLQCDIAEDGVQAVALAALHPYRLILMDMQMPLMDGLEATRRIRAQPHGAGPAVVAMTANAFADDKARCLAAGMDDFIGKPVDAQLLFATLLKWLGAEGGHPSLPT